MHLQTHDARSASNDALALGVSLLASLVLYGLFLRHGVAPAVVGYNLVPSERVLGGEAPYRDFLYNYTPGTPWVNAVLFKVLGISLFTARIGVLAAKAVTALLLFLVARRYVSPALAVLTVAMMVAWVGYGDILKVFPTQYGMPLLLGSCLALLRAQESEGRSSRVWFIVSGLMAGGVFVFKHNVGVFVLLALIGSAAACANSNHGRNWKALLIGEGLAILGFLIVAGAACLFLSARHALLPMLAHFVHHASVYGEAKGIALPPPRVLLPFIVAAALLWAAGVVFTRMAPGAKHLYLVGALVLLLAVVIVGDAAPGGAIFRSMVANVYYLPIYFTAAGAIWAVILYRREKRPEFARAVTLASFALAAFLEIFPRSDPDHLVRVIPPSLLLMCAMLVKREQDNVSDRGTPAPPRKGGSATRSRAAGLGVPLFVAGVCALVIALGIRVTWAPQFVHGLEFRTSAPLLFDRGSGVSDTPQEAARLNGVVNFIQNNTVPGDPILAVSRKMTSLYFFAARPNITRLLWLDSAGILSDERDGIHRMIGDHRFKLVVVGGDQGGSDPSEGDAAEDEDTRTIRFVRENYHVEVIINGVSVFAPNP
ncbi:MAG TPA: glycosyltransferase family 39 protein [Blastocatellia bacterium]|nr:glycosyltransferase family 39 protein [Blastocatellia bacterium]